MMLQESLFAQEETGGISLEGCLRGLFRVPQEEAQHL